MLRTKNLAGPSVRAGGIGAGKKNKERTGFPVIKDLEAGRLYAHVDAFSRGAPVV